MEHEDQLMSKIQKSFFLLEPLDNLLVNLICVNKDFNQHKLLLHTIHHDMIKRFPNKLDYTVRYLKQLISLLEYNSVEVLETIYTEYVSLLRTKAEEKDYYYRHFMVNDKTCVIKNTYSMISKGTTGLCVWEGALVLAEWCLQNENLLKGKNIVELGCGVGMAGLIVIQNCDVKTYLFSDCNDEVLSVLKHNVWLNIECDKKEIYNTSTLEIIKQCDEVSDVLSDIISKVSDVHIAVNNHDEVDTSLLNKDSAEVQTLSDTASYRNSSVSIRKLSFEELSHSKSAKFSCDIILASDIIYDSDLFASLKNALVKIFDQNKNCLAIFACKIRNQITYQSFLDILKDSKLFQVTEENLRHANLMFFSDPKMVSMVKILSIKGINQT